MNPLVGMTDIAVGLYHSLALGKDGKVRAWGHGKYVGKPLPTGVVTDLNRVRTPITLDLEGHHIYICR